jgi:hypothetical protein
VLYCVEVIKLVKVYHNELNKKNHFLQKSIKTSSKKNIRTSSSEDVSKNNYVQEYGSSSDLPKYTVVNHQVQNRTNSNSAQNNYYSENDEHERKLPTKTVERSNINSFKDKFQDVKVPKEDFQKEYPKFNNNPEYEYEEEDQPKYLEDNNQENQINYEENDNPRENELQTEQANNNNISQNSNNLANTSMDLKILTDIIGNLSNSVKEMVRRVDDFKASIETRVSKIEAEVSLIKNRVLIIEEEKNQPLSTNREEHNPTTFSFADDNSAKKEEFRIERNRAMKMADYKSEINNKISANQKLNMGSINRQNLPDDNQKSTKEDTDIFIDRIANRFKETQKLLNEIK